MFRLISKLSFAGLIAAALVLSVTSCTDSEADTIDQETVQNYVDQSVFNFQSEGKVGKFGCYEFVFPITIAFPDGNTATVDGYEALKETIKTWIEENGEDLGLPSVDSVRRGHGRFADIPRDQLPSFVFPLEVVSQEGELMTIEGKEGLKELRRACRRDFFDGRAKPGHRKGYKCFKLIFPVTIEFPGGSQFTAASKQALKAALREWKHNNPDTDRRPQLVFPVNIEFRDGSTAEVASKEALKAIKDKCSDG